MPDERQNYSGLSREWLFLCANENVTHRPTPTHRTTIFGALGVVLKVSFFTFRCVFNISTVIIWIGEDDCRRNNVGSGIVDPDSAYKAMVEGPSAQSGDRLRN